MLPSKSPYGYFFLASLMLLLLTTCTVANDDWLPENDLPLIRMEISPTDMLRVRHKRERAIQQGMLVTKGSDYVNATLHYKEQELTAEVRLKGDWLDHLRGNKWSWRVKLSDTCQLDGMQKFSLQHPRVRSYLDEWVFHKLLQQEGILTTRYTFVHLVLNGRDKGVYALEEHFDKALLHANQRPEAPILKFSEDGFWQAQAIHKKTGKNLTHFMPVFESAEIQAFQKKSILKTPDGVESYQAAKNKLELMRLAKSEAADIVDVKQMASWYALSDLVESYHSLRWHNMRFYYHPIKGVLEPVVYDAFGSQGAYRWFRKPLLGSYTENSDTVWLGEEMIVFSLLNDSLFRESYHQYLKKYAQPGFIDSFMAGIRLESEKLELVLKSEFDEYEYDRDRYENGAKRLRDELKTFPVHPPVFERVVSSFLFDSCRSELPIPEVALHVTPVSDTMIELVNWFCEPITIEAVGIKKSDQRAIEHIVLPPFNSQTWPPDRYTLPIQVGEQYYYYTVPANDSRFRQKISPWPKATSDSMISLTELQIDTTFMKLKGSQIKVEKGNHSLTKVIVIPSGFELLIKAGVQIDLTQRAAMLIAGDVHFEGDAKNRIKIYSSDQSSLGVHMLGATSSVNIDYTDFQDQGDWWGPERWFKGGVSILESDVSISHCSFKYMRGEDALNIVGTNKLSLKNINFAYCEGDALDLDYCTADLDQLFFENIGGDGLDFSGSIVNGTNIEILWVADKGISIGEESKVNIHNVNIDHVNLGIGVKDASEAILGDLNINNCPYGVAVFNKKPIFTAASAEIVGFEHQNVPTPYVLERNHYLKINEVEQNFTHDARHLVDVFYPQVTEF